MSRTTIYMVSDDNTTIEKARQYWEANGVTVQVYSPTQWSTGLDSPVFRQTIGGGVPSLTTGSHPLAEGAKVLQFPTNSPSNGNNGRVSTINELESQAITNAIQQYKGNLTEAAKALGIGRATLYRKVKQYNIDPSLSRKKRAA